MDDKLLETLDTLAHAIRHLRKDVQALGDGFDALRQRVLELERQVTHHDLAKAVGILEKRVKGLRRRVCKLEDRNPVVPSKGTDGFGTRQDTKLARVNAVLSEEPMTMNQIKAKAEIEQDVYNHMNRLIRRKLVEKVGNGYRLTVKGLKAKAGAEQG
jgi:hypothetical protein